MYFGTVQSVDEEGATVFLSSYDQEVLSEYNKSIGGSQVSMKRM